VDSLFLAVAGQLKCNGRYETQRGAFSKIWLEFEDLFASASHRRRSFRTGTKGASAPFNASGAMAADGDASDEEFAGMETYLPGEANSFPQAVAPLGADLEPTTPTRDMDRENLCFNEDQRKEVAMLENMIQDHQSKYEATIRQHLQLIQRDGGDADSKRFPELYANVRKWQEQLEPVLKEFSKHPEFDIEMYSMKLLAGMSGKMSKNEGQDIFAFADLVSGCPRWEVSALSDMFDAYEPGQHRHSS